MSPKNKFYEVTVTLSKIDEKGKEKRKKEVYLIDAADTHPIEKKISEIMVDNIDWDWDVTSIRQSKIIDVYIDKD